MSNEKPPELTTKKRVQFNELIEFQHALNEVVMCSLGLDMAEVEQELAMWVEQVREWRGE